MVVCYFFVAMQPPASPQRLLRLPEAALQLSVSLRTIHVLIASGALASVRIGRSVRVRPSALEQFVEARETRGKISNPGKRKKPKTGADGN